MSGMIERAMPCIILSLYLSLSLSLSFSLALFSPIPGNYAAIEVAGIVFTPFLTFFVNRKCVDVEDLIAAAMAFAGVICVTQPTFIFGVSSNVKPVPFLA